MFEAIALFVLYVVMVVTLTRSTMSKKIQHEWFIALTGGMAFVYMLVAVMWVGSILGPYGQAPSFSLLPYLILGLITTIGAIRSSIVYNRKYGITLA